MWAPITKLKVRKIGRICFGVGASVLLFGCGSGSDDGSASSSSSTFSSSSTNSSSSAVSSASPASVSYESALDWDWRTAAQNYCAAHQTQPVVPGSFRVLRPEQSRHLHESAHFVLRWNDDDGVNIGQATIDQALATLENVWDVYINQLGFPEPYWDTATKYKVSVNVSNQGYASGAGTGERDPEMWVHYDALAHVGTLAHEFAHTLQFTTRSMRDSQYVGWLWESHANWMAHQFNPQDVQCTEALVNAPHIYYGSTRNRYCNWQFFEFVKDNSCIQFVNDALWKDGVQPEDPAHWSADPFSTLADNAQWSTAQLNDIFADWSLHNVHWDYRDNGATYRQRYGSNSSIEGARRFRVTRLISTDRENEYEVPHYWAPQRWGYNIVELLPQSDREHIWVEFEGVVQDTPAVSSFSSGFELQPQSVQPPNSDWRWSVVVTESDGRARYSELQRGASGRLKVDRREGDKSIWLVVMASPVEIQQIFWDQIYYSVYRYPWRVSLDGARPTQYQDEPINAATGSGAPHPNGGGWVAASAEVAGGVYVGPHARVLGNARISGSVRIEDQAIVKDNAQISGAVIVRHHALVAGSAVVKDSAVVEDHAAVWGGTVQERARVGALSLVEGRNTLIGGDAVVTTTMNTINGRSVTGSAQLIGDVELNTSISRGVFYGFIDSAIATDPAYGANRAVPVDEVTAK